MGRNDKKEKLKQLILNLLNEKNETLSSRAIMQMLQNNGVDISERTIRIYLTEMDNSGVTEAVEKKGRKITDKGKERLNASQLISRIGYMSTRIDNMTYQMNFDLALRRGTVVVNTAIVSRKIMKKYLDRICRVFEQGYAMGTLVSIINEGETIENLTIPQGKIGFCTVCSVTLNGVLLKHGIPTRSLFSGLLELHHGKATQFTELINYDGTSIDPLQLFIRSRLTNYTGAITNGNGKIGAGYREIPENSYKLSCALAEKLADVGLGAFMKIGKPSQDLLNIPVKEGNCGVIVIGGLNPVAILEENGAEVTHYAISGLKEYNTLYPYYDMKKFI